MRLKRSSQTFLNTQTIPSLNLYNVVSQPVIACSWQKKSDISIQIVIIHISINELIKINLHIQFHWQLETTYSCFWLVNIFFAEIWYFINVRNRNDKNTHFMMKNKIKMPKKYMKALSNIFYWTLPTDSWCNMLQTLERPKKYIGFILSDEHTFHITWREERL